MAANRKTLSERCRQIDMLVVDVDGVLTAGSIAYGDDGLELKAFHVRDGTGLKIWTQSGKRAAIISGRSSTAVVRRARELGIRQVFQGVQDKLAAFSQLLSAAGLEMERACFVGDDLPDLAILLRCGLAVAVADASTEARAAAHYLTRRSGGAGAVREVIELILHCQNAWPKVVERFQSAKAED